MSGWQEKLLSEKLVELDKHIKHRKRVTSLYEGLLKEKDMETMELPDYYDTVFLRYPVLVKGKNKILSEAKRSRVELGDWFLSPVYPNLSGWEKINYKKGMCQVAEHICRHAINLPTHQNITEREINAIVKVISQTQ